jgi:hypothetical protein
MFSLEISLFWKYFADVYNCRKWSQNYPSKIRKSLYYKRELKSVNLSMRKSYFLFRDIGINKDVLQNQIYDDYPRP